jgi:putative PIN family toxin of toxin-antitoxin system
LEAEGKVRVWVLTAGQGSASLRLFQQFGLYISLVPALLPLRKPLASASVRIVIDTNVLISALRSSRGASFSLLQRLGSGRFEPVISPPLCLEYEDVLRRPDLVPHYSPQDISDFLDYILSESIECRVYFLWRPHIPDPKDDLVLEVALAGNAEFIVTHNARDFQGVGSLGITAVTPDEFLAILRSR